MIPIKHPRIYLTAPNPNRIIGGYTGIIIPADKDKLIKEWNYWGPVPVSEATIYAKIARDQRKREGKDKAIFAHFPTEKAMLIWARKYVHRIRNPHLYDA